MSSPLPTPSVSAYSSDFLRALAATQARAQTLEELVRPLLELLQRVTGLDSTYLTTVDEHAGMQHVLFARNSRRMEIPEGLSVRWEGTLCKRALEEERYYCDDVAQHWGDSEAAKALGIATYVSTPVRTDSGQLFGTLCAASDESKPMSAGAEEVLKLFARMIVQEVEREKRVEALNQANSILVSSALTDHITQLPNRRALVHDLQRRLDDDSTPRALIVAFIDLDNFKTINDRHGHDVGDRFLEAIAQRLRRALRSGDLAARIGGDEFVVLATADDADANNAAASLQKRLTAATLGHYQLGSAELDYAGPSVGVVVASANSNAEQVLSDADAAMYSVKRARKAARN